MRQGLRLPLRGPEWVVRVGVEQEYRVLDGDRPVDFRRLLPLIAGGIRPLDPGDPRARRLPSDVVVTADGLEAELSSPPLPASHAGIRQVVELLGHERRRLVTELEAVLAHPRVEGFSTHLNISVQDGSVVAVARAFAQRCVPAVAAVTEGPDSLGILVRPRRGRLEIGCDYVDGDRLDEALQVARACVDGLVGGDQPPLWCAEPEASREKFGWFLPPGPPRPDQDLSRWVQSHRAGLADAHRREIRADTSPRQVDELVAECEWVTWETVCWAISSSSRTLHAVVSTGQEAEFLDLLDRGELTPLIRRALAERGRRRLLVNRQIRSGALWHDVRPGALVPAERDGRGRVPRVRMSRARQDAYATP